MLSYYITCLLFSFASYIDCIFMPNFLTYFKENHPNIHSLLVSFFLALWYNGISGFLNHYWPKRGIVLSVIFLLIPLVVFLDDDQLLDELYRQPKKFQPDNTAPDVIISSSRVNGFKQIN